MRNDGARDVNNLDGLSSAERDAVLLVLRNLRYEVYLNGQPLAGNA